MKQRADGRWEQKITVDGKRKAFYSSAKTERAAKADIQKQILEYNKEHSGECPFKTVAGKWADFHKQKIPFTTWKKCYRASYNIVVEYLDKFSVQEVTAAECNRFLQIQISKGKSQKTISTLKSVVSMILDYAILEGLIQYNSMKNIKLPANLPKEPRSIPSDEDIKKIKENYQDFDLLPYFLMYSGLRMSEALALTDDDIDFENKLIKVNKKVVHDDNTPIIVHQTKTVAGKREVILLDRLAEKIPKFEGLLFHNGKNELYTKRQIQCAWDRWKKKLGVDVTAHQLRHAYATLLYESGIDVKTAQNLMGHADLKMTMDVYADLRAKKIDSARTKLNKTDF